MGSVKINLIQNKSIIGSVSLPIVLEEGFSVGGIDFDLKGKGKIFREARRAIFENSLQVSIKGGSFPDDLSLYAEGVIKAIEELGSLLNFSIKVEFDGDAMVEDEDDLSTVY